MHQASFTDAGTVADHRASGHGYIYTDKTTLRVIRRLGGGRCKERRRIVIILIIIIILILRPTLTLALNLTLVLTLTWALTLGLTLALASRPWT